MTRAVGVLLLLGAVGCSSTTELEIEGPIWPPMSAGAPADVSWYAQIDLLRSRGSRRIFRALAGAESRDQRQRLRRPVAVASVGDRLFVVDTALQSVVACDLDGRGARRLPLPPGFFPVAVAASHDGQRVLIADRSSGAVHVFDSTGDPRGAAVGPGKVSRCGGLAICANGDILMTDSGRGQVVRFSADGRELVRKGEAGSGTGEYNIPTAVVEAPDGTVWVLDTFNFRLQHLDETLERIGGFGEHGDASGQIALGKGLAVDPDGHLYLSDARFDVVQVFDSAGRLLFVIGAHGTRRGEFWNPAGISCDTRGVIAVADTGNRRVQLLQYRRKEGSS